MNKHQFYRQHSCRCPKLLRLMLIAKLQLIYENCCHHLLPFCTWKKYVIMILSKTVPLISIIMSH